MNWPFVVWSLPRSRSAWLQYYLGGPGLVGHDLALRARSPNAWLDLLWHGRTGSCETGTPDLWPLARIAMPTARFLTIRRGIGEVVESLARHGIVGVEKELERRSQVLDEIEAAGAPSIPYKDLDDPSCCAWMFEYLTGLPFDFTWWQVASSQNVQINLAENIAWQHEHQAWAVEMQARCELAREKLTKLKYLRIGREPWDSFWADEAGMAEEHFLATHGGVFPNRPFAMDVGRMKKLEQESRLLIGTARQNGKLVGHIMWTFDELLMSKGTVVAHQGPFWAEPKVYGVAAKLIDWSLTVLPQLGIKSLDWQHNTYGRSATLGRSFLRKGARMTKVTYTMELEGGTHG